MSVEIFLIYVGAVVVLCLTPGPNSLLALKNGAQYGVRRAVYSTLGCATGGFMVIAACLVGLDALLAASEMAFTILKMVGCAYLVWIGISLVRDRSSIVPTTETGRSPPHRTGVRLYLQGLMVVISNPKVLLFFSAFLPQFYNPEQTFWPQLAVLAGTFVLIEVCLELCLAVFAERIWQSINTSKKRRWVNGLTGGLFISAGVLLLAAERPK